MGPSSVNSGAGGKALRTQHQNGQRGGERHEAPDRTPGQRAGAADRLRLRDAARLGGPGALHAGGEQVVRGLRRAGHVGQHRPAEDAAGDVVERLGVVGAVAERQHAAEIELRRGEAGGVRPGGRRRCARAAQQKVQLGVVQIRHGWALVLTRSTGRRGAPFYEIFQPAVGHVPPPPPALALEERPRELPDLELPVVDHLLLHAEGGRGRVDVQAVRVEQGSHGAAPLGQLGHQVAPDPRQVRAGVQGGGRVRRRGDLHGVLDGHCSGRGAFAGAVLLEHVEEELLREHGHVGHETHARLGIVGTQAGLVVLQQATPGLVGQIVQVVGAEPLPRPVGQRPPQARPHHRRQARDQPVPRRGLTGERRAQERDVVRVRGQGGDREQERQQQCDQGGHGPTPITRRARAL